MSVRAIKQIAKLETIGSCHLSCSGEFCVTSGCFLSTSPCKVSVGIQGHILSDLVRVTKMTEQETACQGQKELKWHVCRGVATELGFEGYIGVCQAE